MSKKILIWMLVLLVLVSSVNALKYEAGQKIKLEGYEFEIKHFENLVGDAERYIVERNGVAYDYQYFPPGSSRHEKGESYMLSTNKYYVRQGDGSYKYVYKPDSDNDPEDFTILGYTDNTARVSRDKYKIEDGHDYWGSFSERDPFKETSTEEDAGVSSDDTETEGSKGDVVTVNPRGFEEPNVPKGPIATEMEPESSNTPENELPPVNLNPISLKPQDLDIELETSTKGKHAAISSEISNIKSQQEAIKKEYDNYRRANIDSLGTEDDETTKELKQKYSQLEIELKQKEAEAKKLEAKLKKEGQTVETTTQEISTSTNKVFNDIDNQVKKDLTYEIGGSNYIFIGTEGDNAVFELVGKAKTSKTKKDGFTGTGSKDTTTTTTKEQYIISQDAKELLDITKSDEYKNVDFSLAITPVKYDPETMDKKDGTLFYKDDYKDKDLAGKPVQVPSTAYTTEQFQASYEKYSDTYNKLKVTVTPTSHTISTTIGSSKKGEKKESGRTLLGGLLGGSSEKEIFLERGQELTIASSAFNRDSTGQIYVTQSWSKEEGSLGDFEGYTYSVKNADGQYVKLEGITTGSWGGIDGDIRAALRVAGVPEDQIEATADRIERHGTKITFNRFMGGLHNAQSWSAISSLFGLDESLSEWRQTVDEIFHDMFLGSEYWAEAICYQATDLPDLDESSIFAYDSDGNLMQTATIVATKQVLNTPNGTKYLYKVSFYVRNPEGQTSRSGIFNRGDSEKSPSSGASQSGLRARGTMGGSKEGGLDKQEKEFWNVIKKGAKEISNTKSKNSRSGTDEDMEFNVQLTGDRTIFLFEENEILGPGDEAIYTKEDTIASYSVYDYTRACIIFEGEKPRNAFYEEVDEICTDVIDISGEAPTTLPGISEGSSGSSGGRGTIGNEFSGSSSGSTGSFVR